MYRTTLLLTGLIVACSSDAEGPGPELLELPPDIHVEAAAEYTYPDGASVTCSFHLNLQWDKADVGVNGRVVYTGRMGGESYRRVLDANGDGLAFFADMAWPTAEARMIRPDSISMDLTRGGEASGSPFWDAFKSLEGRKEDGVWSGPWTCKPFGGDTGGYVDTSLTAPGQWQVTTPFVQQP